MNRLRTLLPLALPLLAAGCLTPGTEPYAGWSTISSAEGGFSIRYLAPPWEVDEVSPPPVVHLEVPFQHAAPPGLPDPPPAYSLTITPGLGGETLTLAQSAEQLHVADGDTVVVPTRTFATRSGLPGHETIAIDRWSRFFRETFVAMPLGTVVSLALESNDDADERDVHDLLASLEAIE